MEIVITRAMTLLSVKGARISWTTDDRRPLWVLERSQAILVVSVNLKLGIDAIERIRSLASRLEARKMCICRADPARMFNCTEGSSAVSRDS